MSAEEKRELAMLVEVSEDHSYSHYLKALARFGQLGEDGLYRGLGMYDELEDLQVSAQCDDASARNGLGLYAWSLEFAPYRVRLSDAERMVKVLKRVERKLQGYDETFESPRSFSDYLMRVATALSVEHFAHFGQKRANGTSPILWSDRAGIRHLIAEAEAGWIARYREQASVEAWAQEPVSLDEAIERG